jgi:general stress protein 26
MALSPSQESRMKAEPQRSAELTRLCRLIENMHVAMLTTSDADGALVSRPMAALEMDGDGALWFFTDLRSSKIEHLRVVNLSFASTAGATYVSLSGRGEIHTDRAHIKRLWTPLARPWYPDGPDSNDVALLKFVPDAAEYWDAPHSKMVRMFSVAASVVTGRPIAQGEHQTLTGLTKRSPASMPG